MLNFRNGGNLVQHHSELPDLTNAKELFLDFETTSFDPGEYGNDPYGGHRICGVCVTADDCLDAWYVPLRHVDHGGRGKTNIALQAGLAWLKDIVETCDDWVNHNVKFDAHFAAVDGAMFQGRLIDTVTLSKIIDSDRGFGNGTYALDSLSLDWLGRDISRFELALKKWLEGYKLPNRRKAKDYGLVPPDIMGDYGCQDVFTARNLYRYVCAQRPDQVKRVWDTEIKFTPVLFDMEHAGMPVNRTQLQLEEYKIMTQLCKLDEELHKLVGRAVEPHTNPGCFEVLVGHFGLPVLGHTEKGEPSFDKYAMQSYYHHPSVTADEKLRAIVGKMMNYKKLNTLLTFFVRPYQRCEHDGYMHSDYNQAVRTARLSCKRPNAQQLSKAAKALVVPKPGKAFLSCDYAQIEFRLICHFIRAVDAIQAYRENADVDFHTWVAEMCDIPRKPAKNVNFAIAFGGGRKKVVSMLSGNMELMAGFGELLDARNLAGDDRKAAFESLCKQRGQDVYETYHDTLPGLRVHTNNSANVAKARGFVFNSHGRRRHLPKKACWRALNAIVQSSAADIMKERTVAVAPRYNKFVRDAGVDIRASVHDETLFYGDVAVTRDPGFIQPVVETLESVDVKFRIPIRCSSGWSDKNWAIASGDEGEIDVPHKVQPTLLDE